MMISDSSAVVSLRSLRSRKVLMRVCLCCSVRRLGAALRSGGLLLIVTDVLLDATRRR